MIKTSMIKTSMIKTSTIKTSMALALLVTSVVPAMAQQDDEKPENPSARWEKAISEFEKSDSKNPVKKDGVLFLGSSSIRLWDLEKWFPKSGYLNRGFGGSEIADSNFFFDRVVAKYKPRTIVFYAGDNDIAKGKSPKTVFEDFKTFVGKVKKSLPETKIVYVAIKPSISRWKLVGKMREANRMIQEAAKKDANIQFADIDKPMIGKDGKPRKELFLKDGLHLNETGYKVWYDVIRPLLK